jgi:hypothetical protein
MEPSANGRVGWVAKSMWPILLPAHHLEKSAFNIKNISIHHLSCWQTKSVNSAGSTGALRSPQSTGPSRGGWYLV